MGFLLDALFKIKRLFVNIWDISIASMFLHTIAFGVYALSICIVCVGIYFSTSCDIKVFIISGYFIVFSYFLSYLTISLILNKLINLLDRRQSFVTSPSSLAETIACYSSTDFHGSTYSVASSNTTRSNKSKLGSEHT